MKKILRAAAAAALAALALTACTQEEPPAVIPECEDLAAPFADPIRDMPGVADAWSSLEGPSCGVPWKNNDTMRVVITIAPGATGADIANALDSLRVIFESTEEHFTVFRMNFRIELPQGSRLDLSGPPAAYDREDWITIDPEYAETALSIDADYGPASIDVWDYADRVRVAIDVPITPDESDAEQLAAIAEGWDAVADAAQRLGIDEGELRVGPTGESDRWQFEEWPEYYFYELERYIPDPMTVAVPAGSTSDLDPAWTEFANQWLEQ